MKTGHVNPDHLRGHLSWEFPLTPSWEFSVDSFVGRFRGAFVEVLEKMKTGKMNSCGSHFAFTCSVRRPFLLFFLGL